MIKNVLFDLDGTLLNMGESAFEKEYLQRMVLFLERRYPGEGKAIVKAVGYGSEAMKKSDGSRSNAEVFWEAFVQASGKARAELEPVITEYYLTDFSHIGDTYVPDADMAQAVRLLAQKGYRLLVATTPIVPHIANVQRVAWSGLGDINWEDITSFEDYNWVKPDLRYYQQICDRFGFVPEECLMVGDSLVKDYPATELGMDFYLILNEDSPEPEKMFSGRKGDRKALLEYVKHLPAINSACE